MHKDLESRNDRLNGLFIVPARRGRPSSTYLPTSLLPPLYSIVYAYINILCALRPVRSLSQRGGYIIVEQWGGGETFDCYAVA